MAFLRFVVGQRDPHLGFDAGPFGLAYRLAEDPGVPSWDRAALREELTWLSEHLPKPTCFNSTRSKGYDPRATRGICWFRDSAEECLARMHHIRQILERQGVVIQMIRDDRIGYVVYEDTFQVVAEPFADTRTHA
jgi:hypothetical protein